MDCPGSGRHEWFLLRFQDEYGIQYTGPSPEVIFPPGCSGWSSFLSILDPLDEELWRIVEDKVAELRDEMAAMPSRLAAPDTALTEVEGNIQLTSEGNAVKSNNQEQEEPDISASSEPEAPQSSDDALPQIPFGGTLGSGVNVNRWGDHFMMVW